MLPTTSVIGSVREDHSGPYLAALKARGIPAFCPRARAYFENDEICLMVASFAVLFGWHGEGRGEVAGAFAELACYVDEDIVQLARGFGPPHPLALALQTWVGESAALREGEALDLRPADFFYRLLALEPFISAVQNENAARNLAIFSQLLNVFQSFYHYTVVTYRNRDVLRLHLFNSFLRLLHDGGINEYEDPDQPFPKGHVQVWPYVQQDLLAAQRFRLRERMPVKRAYSFTGDLKIYETCPRQYQFFREYDFTPSRAAVIFFGLLVHQTIEEIHRIALDGKLDMLDEPRIRALFGRQLCTYANIVERRHGRHVDRLLLSWTSEPCKEDALMVLPYDPKRVEDAGRYFDATVRRIQAREFAVKTPSEPGICQECDLRMLCHAEGIITTSV